MPLRSRVQGTMGQEGDFDVVFEVYEDTGGGGGKGDPIPVHVADCYLLWKERQDGVDIDYSQANPAPDDVLTNGDKVSGLHWRDKIVTEGQDKSFAVKLRPAMSKPTMECYAMVVSPTTGEIHVNRVTVPTTA